MYVDSSTVDGYVKIDRVLNKKVLFDAVTEKKVPMGEVAVKMTHPHFRAKVPKNNSEISMTCI